MNKTLVSDSFFGGLTLQNTLIQVESGAERRQGKNNRLSPFRRWGRIQIRIQVFKVIHESIRKCVRTQGPIGQKNPSVSQTCPYLRSAGPARRMLCNRVVKLALSRANLRSGLPWRDNHCCSLLFPLWVSLSPSQKTIEPL